MVIKLSHITLASGGGEYLTHQVWNVQLIKSYAKCCISVLKILAFVQVCHAHVRKDGRLALTVCICVSEWGTLGTRQHAKVYSGVTL